MTLQDAIAEVKRAADADWTRGIDDIKGTAPDYLSDWQRGLVAGIAAFRDAILALIP